MVAQWCFSAKCRRAALRIGEKEKEKKEQNNKLHMLVRIKKKKNNLFFMPDSWIVSYLDNAVHTDDVLT